MYNLISFNKSIPRVTNTQTKTLILLSIDFQRVPRQLNGEGKSLQQMVL